jgi:hypothetical protein
MPKNKKRGGEGVVSPDLSQRSRKSAFPITRQAQHDFSRDETPVLLTAQMAVINGSGVTTIHSGLVHYT